MLREALFFALVALFCNNYFHFFDVITTEPEMSYTVPEIIRMWGYPVEEHEVTTKDGYVLTVFRIKHGVNSTAESDCSRPPIVMDHSIMCDGAEYVLNPPESSPAMILADAGFDVFLLNHRGSTYSRRHRDFDTNDRRFWEFTIDEYAKYDNPAVLNYVLNVTGQQSLYWLGHSQGAVLAMMLLSEKPQYNEKIRTLFQLTPPGTGHYARGLWQLGFLTYRMMKSLYDILPITLGSYEVGVANRGISQTMSRVFCAVPGLHLICHYSTHLGMGPPNEAFNHSRWPVYSSHFPSSTSTWNMLHWGQIATRKKLEHFDINEKENLARYGQPSPPAYNLSAVNAPVHIFWSSADWMVPREDIEENLLPMLRKEIVKGVYNVPEYNHIDFVYATNNAEKVFNRIIRIVREQEEEEMCDR